MSEDRIRLAASNKEGRSYEMTREGVLRSRPFSKNQFVTIPSALAALARMERQLDSGKSYEQIRKLADAAEALKVLFRDVAEVKNKAELVVLAASARMHRVVIPNALERYGIIDDKESIGRIFFEGRVNG